MMKANDAPRVQPHVNASGWLEVGDGHKVYWEDWGNAKAKTAVMHLHGGPGSGFSDSHKALYDPAQHRVIFHDQRGCGRSKPFASTEHNTTQDLVADIERLREHFGLERVYVAGGSWGSTLALVYAIAHPQRVKRLLLWSIYLARQSETDWVNAGGPKVFLPVEWERFIGMVPEGQRQDGTSIMRYYAGKIRSRDAEEARRYAVEWSLWEGALISLNYDPQQLEAETVESPGTTSTAVLETHYFMNGCFMPENYLLENVGKIAQIPCDVVQGRFDLCTPAVAAYDLVRAYGEKARWWPVNSGHRRSDPAMLQELRVLAAEHLR
jgi:proline iminopeptidase